MTDGQGRKIMVVGRRIGAAMVLAFAAVGAPFPGLAADAMSKSALQGLAPGLARDFGPRGITVNATPARSDGH